MFFNVPFPESNLRISETLRRRLVQDIEAITEEVDKKIAAMREQFRFFPNIYRRKEIWVYVFRRSFNERLGFGVTEMPKQYARKLAARMEERGQFRLARADEFRRHVKKLKFSIKNGSIDQILRMKAQEALWEILGYNGKYAAVFQDRSISL